ncbi:MAG TPA: type III pantothenate kinase [Gemmatimonadaceae bacterium]|jgi:type III pantothenate kinase|nr:type III pantothenate kinase [Gemmatimonadaceae bacterium]
MIVAFDVGNTETTIGLFAGPELQAHWRIMTDVARTPDEFGLLLDALLSSQQIARSAVTGAVIGSVVPPVTVPLAQACAHWLAVEPVIVDAGSPLPIVLDVDEPRTVGADRIINTLAASRMYKCDTIVVDLGTATTYDCITADGIFLGGIIAPGVRTSADTLVRRTSKLPATELLPPARAIGKRTEECIRSGVMFGAADEVDGLVRRIKREWPTSSVPRVVATGGLAESIAPLCTEVQLVEPFLTLYGLRMAHELLTGACRA